MGYIRVILRTRSDDDLIRLRKEVAGTVLCAKEELAKGMVDLILKHFSSITADVVQKK